MFNLFSARRDSDVEVVRDHKRLLERMSQIVQKNTPALDALGDLHGDVDLVLVERIEATLLPLIGPSGCGPEHWFQSMDFYGDGIRHLEFKPGQFPLQAIGPLRSLLAGEHSSFGILCWAPESSEGQVGDSEGVVVFNGTLLFTPRLARSAAHA